MIQQINMSVCIVTRVFMIVVPREDMNAQSMKVLN